jgi:tryptophan-rich sensory protein
MSSNQLEGAELRFSRREAPVRDVVGLALSVLLALMVATVAGLATVATGDGWYANSTTALWNPPAHIFGPLWTVLYTVVAMAAWLVWRTPVDPERLRALQVYGGVLALSAGWPPMFFLLYEGIGGVGLWLALGWILVLDFAVLWAIILFWRHSKLAALLLIPYWTWSLFATALNASLAVMNG